MIQFDEKRNLFRLEGTSFSYLLGFAPDGDLHHFYWGSKATELPKVFSKTILYIAINEGPFDRLVRIKGAKFGFNTILKVLADRAAMTVFDAKGKILVGNRLPKEGF